MCGRFAQYSPLQVVCETFDISVVTCEAIPSYNIAPAQEILVVIQNNGNRLGKLTWGLVPSWTKDLSKASRYINARAETLEKKQSFCNAFKKQRCLIVADGFFEWKQKGSQKQPWYFTLPSKKPFAFAGLWETWKKNDGTIYNSCAIITTKASKSVIKIHNRMPVILVPQAYDKWLTIDNQDVKQLKAVLHDCHVTKLAGHPVSKMINSVKNNDARCIKPVSRTLGKEVFLEGKDDSICK